MTCCPNRTEERDCLMMQYRDLDILGRQLPGWIRSTPRLIPKISAQQRGHAGRADERFHARRQERQDGQELRQRHQPVADNQRRE